MASILKVDTIQESTPGVGTNFSNTGSASTPTISIGNQTNKGFYHSATDTIGISVGGSRVGQIGVGYGGFTGNIIQVVSGERSTRISTTSTSNIDAGISATIIPKYSTSKIIVIVTLTIGPGNVSGLLWDIIRNSTKIAQGTGGNPSLNSTGGVYTDAGSSAGNGWVGSSAIIIDSPSTISSTTYKIEFRSHTGSMVAINGRGSDSQFSGYSTILLMELQQ